MSGKKDKESRRLTASVDKKMKAHLRSLEEAKKIDHAGVIETYNQFLRRMAFSKRCRFAISLLFSGANKNG